LNLYFEEQRNSYNKKDVYLNTQKKNSQRRKKKKGGLEEGRLKRREA
jgi:hypothetical protein